MIPRDRDSEREILAKAAGDESSPFVVHGIAWIDKTEREEIDWFSQATAQSMLEEMQASAACIAAEATLFIHWIRAVFTDPDLVRLFESSAEAVLDAAAHQHLVVRESRAELEVLIEQE